MEWAPAKGCSANGAQAIKSASTTRTWTAGIPETSKEAAQSSPTAQATAAQSTRLCSSVPEWRTHLRLALQGRERVKIKHIRRMRPHQRTAVRRQCARIGKSSGGVKGEGDRQMARHPIAHRQAGACYPPEHVNIEHVDEAWLSPALIWDQLRLCIKCLAPVYLHMTEPSG